MPRGVKRERNIPEEIASVNEQISRHEGVIKTLKAQLSALQEEQEQQELKNLNRLLKESGLTAKDLEGFIVKPREDIA
jgi:predicted nuclease with TOPRIM domain